MICTKKNLPYVRQYVIVAVYEKDGIALGGLKKISASINMGTSKIDLDILSFSVDPIKTYVVRIFSWTAITTLKPIAEAFITDVKIQEIGN